jgi:hypothetical protein
MFSNKGDNFSSVFTYLGAHNYKIPLSILPIPLPPPTLPQEEVNSQYLYYDLLYI